MFRKGGTRMMLHRATGRKHAGGHVDGKMPASPSSSPSAPHLHALQRAFGNQALVQMMRSRAVVQRKDEYFPSGDKEPHIHIHHGGITFTGVGHNHKALVRGDQVRVNSIMEAYQELQDLDTDRANRIIDWMRHRFGIDPPARETEQEAAGGDEHLPSDWVERETDDTPSGTPPPGFSFGAYTSKL